MVRTCSKKGMAVDKGGGNIVWYHPNLLQAYYPPGDSQSDKDKSDVDKSQSAESVSSKKSQEVSTHATKAEGGDEKDDVTTDEKKKDEDGEEKVEPEAKGADDDNKTAENGGDADGAQRQEDGPFSEVSISFV